jgi:hypothetical protein
VCGMSGLMKELHGRAVSRSAASRTLPGNSDSGGSEPHF